jgi:hypothetical protein
MEKKADRCYFCNELAQYNYTMQIIVCSHHWDMMYNVKVPNHIHNSQILNYKKLALEKHIWKV